jgi:FkbH-like protein
LASLELEVTFFKNKESLVSRMSQMTQKTNQFNLTSRRYTEVEIRSIVLSSNTDVYAFSLRDKFGDSGVTGLCIVDIDNDTAVIDNFLMSCRVIGRNIEYVFMDYIVNSLKDKNIINIKSVFIRTMKNMQVEEFYDRCSFSLIKTKESIRYYELSINNYKQNNIKYIKEAGDGC